DAINRMKIELGEKNATIFSLEAREKAVKEQLRATEEEFAAKTEMLRNAEKALTDKQGELAKINHELSDRSMMADSRQVELVAVRAQIDELKNRVGDAEKEFAATQARLAQERTESENATQSAGGNTPSIERLRGEKAAVEEQLRVARDERAKLQRDINAMQQQAESSWATERMENALLRERINDIAAEVAKLAMQLEGPNSPIDAMLAAEPAPGVTPAKSANGSATATAPEGGSTLAERIRALQS